MWQKAWMPVAGGCCVSAVCPSVAWLLQLIGWCLFVGDLTHHKMGRARQAHCGSPSPTVDTIFYIARINHRRQQQPTLNPFRWAATTSDSIECQSRNIQYSDTSAALSHKNISKIVFWVRWEGWYLWWFPNRSKKLSLVRWLIIATRRGRGPAPGSSQPRTLSHTCNQPQQSGQLA